MEKPRHFMGGMRESVERTTKWHVVESFSEARDHERGSEDGYLITDHCIAVFDGVSRNGTKYDGVTPGQFAVQTVREAFAARSDLRADDAARFATETLRRAAAEQHIEHAALVFAAFFPKENRIVRVGDCSYLIDGTGHNPGIMPDRAKAELRRRIIAKAVNEGKTEEDMLAKDADPARDRMKTLRTWQEYYANNDAAPDLGYGVVNGTDIPDRFVEIIEVPEGTRSVVLASDGYPTQALKESFAETEAELKVLQERDPLGTGETMSVRANKPSEGQTATDDRTYIKIAP